MLIPVSGLVSEERRGLLYSTLRDRLASRPVSCSTFVLSDRNQNKHCSLISSDGRTLPLGHLKVNEFVLRLITSLCDANVPLIVAPDALNSQPSFSAASVKLPVRVFFFFSLR